MNSEWKDNKRIIDLKKLVDAKFDVENEKIKLENLEIERDELIKNKDKHIKEIMEKDFKNNKTYQKNKKRLEELESERSRLDNRELLK